MKMKIARTAWLFLALFVNILGVKDHDEVLLMGSVIMFALYYFTKGYYEPPQLPPDQPKPEHEET